METAMRSGIIKRIFRWVAALAGVWLMILVGLELFLRSSAVTGIVNRVAADYIDGELSFGKVQASMFRHFPSASLSLEDFHITYPAERFDNAEKQGADGPLFRAGHGESADTLASFKRFTASVRLGPLMAGKIHIPLVELAKPRIYAHQYADGRSNWDIFKVESEEEVQDSTDAGIPDIMLGRINLTDSPRIIYTDNGDTLSAIINLKQMRFSGRLDTRKPGKSRISLALDSMFVAGRSCADTVALGLDHLGISEKDRHLKIHATANAFASTESFSRITVPMTFKGHVTLPRHNDNVIVIDGFTADFAKVPLRFAGTVGIYDDRLALDIKGGITNCKVNDVIKELISDMIPSSRNIITNSTIDLQAAVSGDYVYDTGRLPAISASLKIPFSEVEYKGFPGKVNLEFIAEAATDSNGRINIDITKADIGADGAGLKVQGKLSDLLSEDPDLNINGRMDIDLHTVAAQLPDSMNVTARGKVSAELNGKLKLSQMDFHGLSRANINGELHANDIRVIYPEEDLNAFISKADISLGPEEKTSRTGDTFRLLALKGQLDSAAITLGTTDLKGKLLSFSAMNSADALEQDTDKVHRFGGKVSAERLILKDDTGMVIGINGSENGFQVLPKKSNPKIPVLTFTSRNKGIFLKDNMNRVILSDAVLGADATMNSIERRQRAKAYIDSLSRAYPDVPKDSLFFHAARKGNREHTMPEWLKEEDFRKQDINFRLDETIAKYFREWDLNGRLAIRKGMLMTPLFPLRNTLHGFEGHFNNNQVSIDTLAIKAGKSELVAKGSLTGIQKILSGRGRNMLNLDVDVTSQRMDADELLRAYTAGMQFDPGSTGTGLTEVSDDEYMQIIEADTASYAKITSPLIVVPSNLIADIRLNAKNINYADLFIERLSANAVMKERCIQITNTAATSNVGDISFDGFYATRSKKDIKAGFNIQFKDITAEKVISLMPAVDTLMPILKSFYGRLNCEMAATTQLDTNMNIMIPSIKGIMRITGDDLSIKESKMFSTLARKLLFKNKKEGHIEHMSVEGIISDSTVEIFPFIIKMDRYTMALSGVQNLDMSFKYHMSLIKSPFLFKLGVDVTGEDFDNWKFKIGKPKYKNADVPAFSSVIDETKVNLVKSIKDIFRKGVDTVVKENSLSSVNEYKLKTNYVRAVDQKLEELSEDEQKQFAAEEAAADAESQSAGLSEEQSSNQGAGQGDGQGSNQDAGTVRNTSQEIVEQKTNKQ